MKTTNKTQPMNTIASQLDKGTIESLNALKTKLDYESKNVIEHERRFKEKPVSSTSGSTNLPKG